MTWARGGLARHAGHPAHTAGLWQQWQILQRRHHQICVQNSATGMYCAPGAPVWLAIPHTTATHLCVPVVGLAIRIRTNWTRSCISPQAA